MRVAMPHQLGRFLRRRVDVERRVGRIGLDEGHLGIGAVGRAGRGHQEMPHRGVPHQLQQVEGADHVGGDIDLRMFQRVAHARLRGQVDHHLRPRGLHHRTHRRHVRHVLDVRGEARASQQRMPRLLQRHVVIRHQAVHAMDLVPVIEQSPAGVVADEAGAAGDQDPHFSPRSHQMPVKASSPSRRISGTACSSGPCCLQPL